MVITGNVATTRRASYAICHAIIYVLAGCILLRTSIVDTVVIKTTTTNGVTAFAAFRSIPRLHNHRQNNKKNRCNNKFEQRRRKRETARQQRLQHVSSSSDDDSYNDEDNEFDDDNDNDDENIPDDDSHLFEENMMTSGRNSEQQDKDEENEKSIMNELSWRTNKILLEEQNDRRFQKVLQSKPWKLPYDVAKEWVKKNLGAETKEEFEDFVLNGNVRTPYIPKDPKRYYTDMGTWLGWEDFLCK